MNLKQIWILTLACQAAGEMSTHELCDVHNKRKRHRIGSCGRWGTLLPLVSCKLDKHLCCRGSCPNRLKIEDVAIQPIRSVLELPSLPFLRTYKNKAGQVFLNWTRLDNQQRTEREAAEPAVTVRSKGFCSKMQEATCAPWR